MDANSDKKLDRIESKLDTIDTRLNEYNVQLSIHVSRQTVLEQQVIPVVKAWEQVKGAGKFVAFVAALASIGALVAMFL